MSEASDPGRSGSAGILQRGFAIVELLATSHQPLSLTQIAEATGIDASSALRILKMLSSSDYVLRDPGSKLYAPGPRTLFPLDLHHPLNVYRRSALPLMQSLADDTGLTAALHVYAYGERMVVDVVQGARPLTPFYDTHVKRPPHVSAAGKIFLLSLPPPQRARALGPAPYPRFTDKTICDADALARDLEESQRRGYATAIEEAYSWLGSVAAPIRARSSRIVGCFIVFGMSESVTSIDVGVLGERVKRAADIFTHTCPSLDAIERLFASASARNDRTRAVQQVA